MTRGWTGRLLWHVSIGTTRSLQIVLPSYTRSYRRLLTSVVKYQSLNQICIFNIFFGGSKFAFLMNDFNWLYMFFFPLLLFFRTLSRIFLEVQVHFLFFHSVFLFSVNLFQHNLKDKCKHRARALALTIISIVVILLNYLWFLIQIFQYF